MMKNKIVEAYPQVVIGGSDAVELYVADFTDRTNSVRGIEIKDSMPLQPNSDKDMDCFVMQNPHGMSILYNIFDDHQFKTEDGLDIQHCECCFFPEQTIFGSWVTFLEIKDCKRSNVARYKEKAKEQIVSSVKLFRDKGILALGQKVYGVISYPRKGKLTFNQTIFEDPSEYKSLYKKHKIHFYATNEVLVESEKSVIPVK